MIAAQTFSLKRKIAVLAPKRPNIATPIAIARSMIAPCPSDSQHRVHITTYCMSFAQSQFPAKGFSVENSKAESTVPAAPHRTRGVQPFNGAHGHHVTGN
ncbi:hypothetical protein [Caballeronia arvi]|uniref:hypothetical protein n=1 Tax=Caballeronia arvi TaxID=1777135 RepID=UPI00117EFFD2|nr:hypothetical protein [Caballeronia arvi]